VAGTPKPIIGQKLFFPLPVLAGDDGMGIGTQGHAFLHLLEHVAGQVLKLCGGDFHLGAKFFQCLRVVKGLVHHLIGHLGGSGAVPTCPGQYLVSHGPGSKGEHTAKLATAQHANPSVASRLDHP
jgi:hypothetical protein